MKSKKLNDNINEIIEELDGDLNDGAPFSNMTDEENKRLSLIFEEILKTNKVK